MVCKVGTKNVQIGTKMYPTVGTKNVPTFIILYLPYRERYNNNKSTDIRQTRMGLENPYMRVSPPLLADRCACAYNER